MTLAQCALNVNVPSHRPTCQLKNSRRRAYVTGKARATNLSCADRLSADCRFWVRRPWPPNLFKPMPAIGRRVEGAASAADHVRNRRNFVDRSDVDLLGNLDGIIDLDAEVPHGAFHRKFAADWRRLAGCCALGIHIHGIYG